MECSFAELYKNEHWPCVAVRCKVAVGVQDLLSSFVEYIKERKTVALEDLAADFGLRVQASTLPDCSEETDKLKLYCLHSRADKAAGLFFCLLNSSPATSFLPKAQM